jgi:FkbM family methyltransferase
MQLTKRKHLRRVILASPFVIVPGMVLLVIGSVAIALRSDCPFWATVKPIWLVLASGRTSASAKPRMRLLETDGLLQRWETPIGEYWMSQKEADEFAVLVDEQQLDIYRTASIIHPGDTVLDCGANIGVFVRKALDRGASRVLAIEPDPYGVTCMRRTYSREIAAGRVIVYPKGVWNVESSLLLDSEGTHSVNNKSGINVPLTTIDHIVDELGLDRLDVIKMDIEGSEKPALEGARAAIRRFRPRLTIATEHKPDDFSAIPALIRSIQPSYKTECGPCVAQFDRLQPFTMQFLP